MTVVAGLDILVSMWVRPGPLAALCLACLLVACDSATKESAASASPSAATQTEEEPEPQRKAPKRRVESDVDLVGLCSGDDEALSGAPWDQNPPRKRTFLAWGADRGFYPYYTHENVEGDPPPSEAAAPEQAALVACVRVLNKTDPRECEINGDREEWTVILKNAELEVRIIEVRTGKLVGARTGALRHGPGCPKLTRRTGESTMLPNLEPLIEQTIEEATRARDRRRPAQD
jgi:hypothetical protein